MKRPKIFLDTNVCNDVADGRISSSEWQRVCKHIDDNYCYQISLITIKEIFGRLARSSESRFEEAKASLLALCAPAAPQFLPYPAAFALRTVLGLKAVARRVRIFESEERLVETISAALLKGLSKAEVKLLHHFDLDHFDKHENTPQGRFKDINEGLRTGKTEGHDRLVIAECLLQDFSQESDMESCAKLAAGIDAALTFSETLSHRTGDKGFDFGKHLTDWGDLMQLYYLCDERMHFITLDKRIGPMIQRSSQSSRVLLYGDFVNSL